MLQDNPLFEELHLSTRLAHRRLEQRLDFYHPTFDAHNNRRMLQDFWGFYQPLERKLVVLADRYLPSPHSQQRRKTPRLEQDLLALGMTQADIAALPLCGRLPAIPTLPQVFGVLYVIDGAALGERIQATHLHSVGDTLGISPSQGGSFFSSLNSSYASATNSYWPELIAMTEAVEAPDFRHLAIQSAIDTLECFEMWLEHRKRSHVAFARHTNALRWSSQFELAPELFCAERLGDIRVA